MAYARANGASDASDFGFSRADQTRIRRIRCNKFTVSLRLAFASRVVGDTTISNQWLSDARRFDEEPSRDTRYVRSKR